jgi:hypothetical protein
MSPLRSLQKLNTFSAILLLTICSYVVLHSGIRMSDGHIAQSLVSREPCRDEKKLEIHHVIHDNLDKA